MTNPEGARDLVSTREREREREEIKRAHALPRLPRAFDLRLPQKGNSRIVGEAGGRGVAENISRGSL